MHIAKNKLNLYKIFSRFKVSFSQVLTALLSNRGSHIYLCSTKFHRRNPVPHTVPQADSLMSQIRHADQQKAAWFESVFCVIRASYIAMLLKMEKLTFFGCEILLKYP